MDIQCLCRKIVEVLGKRNANVQLGSDTPEGEVTYSEACDEVPKL
jgi:hypothetical protein